MLAIFDSTLKLLTMIPSTVKRILGVYNRALASLSLSVY